MSMAGEPGARTVEAVRVAGASKHFGAVAALEDVDLLFRAGEIHALLGENGAGKTTLVRILAGLEHPDAGTVELWDEPAGDLDARSARRRGVALVQQHFTLVPTLTASQNLVLARPTGALVPPARVAGQRLGALVERFGLDVRDGVPVAQLAVGEQQRLEILRALDADATVLLLDEPTAVLTGAEATGLLQVCRRLADEGRAVVIITHRLAEVVEGCDRVTVLRDGAVVLADAAVADHTVATLADAMVGTGARCGPPPRARRSSPPTPRPASSCAPCRPGCSGTSASPCAVARCSASPASTATARPSWRPCSSGVDAPDAGTVVVDGDAVPHGVPRERIRRRIAYIPSDRYRTALVRPLSLADNIELGRGGRWRPRRRRRERSIAARLSTWKVRSAGPGAPVRSLSGGNAQKLVLARELDSPPDVVISCHPTRGLDPGRRGHRGRTGPRRRRRRRRRRVDGRRAGGGARRVQPRRRAVARPRHGRVRPAVRPLGDRSGHGRWTVSTAAVELDPAEPEVIDDASGDGWHRALRRARRAGRGRARAPC